VFVTFEGLDGSGKTTQVELLRETLQREGREVVATREPGGTPLGEEIRRLLLHWSELSPWAEAALFAAARAELVSEVIRPALDRGAAVLCDRYVDSSLAYQGIARELGTDRVLDLNLAAVDGVLPERTFVLLVEPGDVAGRIDGEPDRIEREDGAFRERVAAAYRELVQLFPNRIVPIDGTLPPEEIAAVVYEHVRELS
jgi:dTMP kinase